MALLLFVLLTVKNSFGLDGPNITTKPSLFRKSGQFFLPPSLCNKTSTIKNHQNSHHTKDFTTTTTTNPNTTTTTDGESSRSSHYDYDDVRSMPASANCGHRRGLPLVMPVRVGRAVMTTTAMRMMGAAASPWR
jgi:hypothetical protein